MPPAGAYASEMTSLVRRNFVEKGVVQIGNAYPSMSALIQTSKVATGGVSPITVPVQGNAMTSPQWIGGDGSFMQPGNMPGFQNAEFNLKAIVVPIPFLGFEGLIGLDFSIIPQIEARMNDAVSQDIVYMSAALMNNTSNNLELIGFPGAIDDGTNLTTYGGISRSTAPWWQSTVVSNSGAAIVPTRNLVLQYISQLVKKQGEMPKLGLCNFGTWTQLAFDFTAQERYNITPGNSFGDGTIQSGFSALMVGPVPIYADASVPEGKIYFMNTDYMGLYIHERAAFYFTGFQDTLANGQFGYIAAILTLLELVNVKPVCQMRVDNLYALPI